jgi:signal peptidase I
VKTTSDTEAAEGSVPDEEKAEGRTRNRNPITAFLTELPGLILTAFVLALIIKTFLVQAFFIPSGSMEPTLVAGDRVLVEKITYRFHDPRLGDVVVFEDPHPGDQPDEGLVAAFFGWLTEGLGVRPPANEDFIKRVIGVPGDVVWAKDGQVFVNGEPIDEPYLAHPTKEFPKTRVPEGKLFVMGDNRNNSLDSRFGLGFVPIDRVVGKTFAIVWPVTDAGLI